MIVYEQRLAESADWALREGSMHFERESAVHKTLRQIAARLKGLNVEYAIAGGMALFIHGYRRFTEDVDILVTAESLSVIHKNLEGLGYVAPFSGSSNLRDTDSGVRIEFLVTGGFPGDGKPKPVAFPDPASASIDVDGIRFLTLPRLVELKLASGMTNARRLQDLADVQRLIEVLQLAPNFADQLDPYVREKYHELWHVVHNNPQ
jgi:hypothetical protein